MTVTTEISVIERALSVIDEELLHMTAREMVTASEVTNVLLDLRVVLSRADDALAAELGEAEPATA